MTDKDDHVKEENKVYVIKKVVKWRKHGAHGGGWKIAYADFVTAMMAFFLLMWLLSLMNKYQLMGVSEYFNDPSKKGANKQSEKEEQLMKGGKDKYLSSKKPSGPSQYHGAEKKSRISSNPEVSTAATGMTKDTNKLKGVSKDAFNRNMTDQNKDNNLTQINDQHSKEYDKKVMENIRDEMMKDLDKNPELRQFKNMLNFKVTADGLKIEIHDLEGKPMFSSGNTDFASYSHTVIEWLANTLNKYPRRVAIIGHTDAAMYDSENYTNWELSADRANATRRALIQSGMPNDQIIRIIGVGDTQPLNKKDGLSPENRRIDIVVLSDESMKKLIH